MATGIKAKETRFSDRRFRSRLEARWGVFFDALGVQYLFESEDFILPDGARYLPDFFVPELDAICEIKPVNHMIEVDAKAYGMVALLAERRRVWTADLHAAVQLLGWGTEESELLQLVGRPRPPAYYVLAGEPSRGRQRGYHVWEYSHIDRKWQSGAEFAECPLCQRIIIAFVWAAGTDEGMRSLAHCEWCDTRDRRTASTAAGYFYKGDTIANDLDGHTRTRRLRRAYEAATGARFEFGEAG